MGSSTSGGLGGTFQKAGHPGWKGEAGFAIPPGSGGRGCCRENPQSAEFGGKEVQGASVAATARLALEHLWSTSWILHCAGWVRPPLAPPSGNQHICPKNKRKDSDIVTKGRSSVFLSAA